MNKILIIEDDTSIRENTAELLTLHHFQVATAENGMTGFAKAKQQLPDVVLCDMMMPKTDGRSFLQMAKNDATLRKVPIIFFSAGTLSLQDQTSLVKAADGFLKKPFLEEDLLVIIEGVLNDKSNK